MLTKRLLNLACGLKFAAVKHYIQHPLFLLIIGLCMVTHNTHADTLLNTTANTSASSDAHNGLLFTMQGSNTIGASLGPTLARGFMQQLGYENLRVSSREANNEYRIEGRKGAYQAYIDVAAHGSSTGFRALNNTSADIAMSSRPIKNKEAAKLARFGDMHSLTAEHVIAIDGIAVIVHPDNPLESLSVSEIAGIFSGQIADWRDISNSDFSGPINTYARDNNSGTWDTFKNLVLDKQYPLTPRAQRFESNDDLSDTVTQDRFGIGFVGLASVRQAKPLSVSDENTKGLLPQHMSVATEDYPLARRLHLYTPPQHNKASVLAFLNFVHSQPGQDIVEKVGFISQNPIAVDNHPNRQGPSEYLSLTQGAKRLSLNFRFKPHSAQLDNKARQDVLRLSQFLKQQQYQKHDLLIIGFGDIKEREQRSLILSKLRASAVKSALHDQGIATKPLAGFGAFKPIANNEGEKKIKNRRVEVWLLPPNKV